MQNFLSTLVARGKTIAGATIVIAGTALGFAAQLSPGDLVALSAVAHGTAVVGQVAIVLGLGHKAIKYFQGKPVL